jgi:signal transduction histidine kinase
MTESSRLTDLVNKFLDLSRLESGHTEVHINPFDLRETVLKVVDGMKSQIDKKQIKVITEITDSIPFGMGDPDMIEQVLSNLLSNAIKYSPIRSKIGIEVKNGKELQVSVIDNGYGIPKEELDRIFDKFYRIPDGSGEEADGTGLGLALVKEIIQRHGKTIQVKSRLGVGSVFSFTLSKAGGNA